MKTIAVFFGGQSPEHDISIITAVGSIMKPLEASGKYQVEAVYIGKDGRWYWDDRLKDISLYQGSGLEGFLAKSPLVQVQFDGGLALTKTGGLTGRKIIRNIDIAFPAMHGTNGEDGCLMGVLRMGNIPFVGCDVEASAIAMNKLLTHVVCQAAGIESHAFVGVHREEYNRFPLEVLKKLGGVQYPLFVKPVRLGSSIGISRVEDEKGLVNALEVALHYDTDAIVEEAVPNLVEVTVPIMGNLEPIPALPEEPATSGGNFFDFETKYLKGGKGKNPLTPFGKGGEKGGLSSGLSTEASAKGGKKSGSQGYSHIPARLSEALNKRCVETALAVYKAIRAEGIARVDLLVDTKAEKVYFNEVNPLPGSLYAHNWIKCGMTKAELVEKLIGYAEEAHRIRTSVTRTFPTNYLKQF